MQRHIVLYLIITLFSAQIYLAAAETKGVKTSYKQYSIYTFQDEDILCEPYKVSKDDWLYKIFRKKGEISEKDFPHFILIFKEINPDISNIDAIEPGNNILIPLKKIEKNDYEQTPTGTIKVPVIEFSATPDDLNLDVKPFLKEHSVKKGETISDLIDKEFLQKGGTLSEEGLKAFQLANPNIKNVNIIYEGAQIYLPDPAIKKQPWFKSLLSPERQDPTKEPTAQETKQQDLIKAHELAQLKRYASLVGGTLLNRGKIYFPGMNNSSHAIDLSTTPIIETKDGSKILIVSESHQNQDLLAHVQAHWQNIRAQALSESLDQFKTTSAYKAKKNKTIEYQRMVKHLLDKSGHDFISNAKIPFSLNKIQLEARFGRIIREDKADILINFGNVYGSALEIIKKKEFEVIEITSKLNTSQAISRLFAALGYSVRDNPSFYTGESVQTIKGIYLSNDKKKFFIPFSKLEAQALQYLEKQDIVLLILEKSETDERN